MTDMMVRKQIYLHKRQDQILKRLAKERGVSEAEIIRQALEHEALQEKQIARNSQQALEAILTFAESLRERPEIMQSKPVEWSRAELYEEREARWISNETES